MTRTEIINALVKGKTSYLEIGYYDGRNHELINCPSKLAVDPSPLTTNFKHNVVKLTSDVFFKTNRRKFDVIFIDGLHEHQQVSRDVDNSLKYLNEGGYIILHDVLPEKLEHTIVPRPKPTGHWNGDVYKAWLKLRRVSSLSMYVINDDNGVGVIQVGEQKPIHVPLEFESITRENMNIISVKEFNDLLQTDI